jgi:predicted nucleic acid-binding protein
MNGNKRFLMDTNAIIAFLQGDFAITSFVHNADWIGISVINEIEFLAFKNLSDRDKAIFKAFKHRIHTIDILSENQDFIQKIIEIRQKYKLKLPDAIVAASAISENVTLLSKDSEFEIIDELKFYKLT